MIRWEAYRDLQQCETVVAVRISDRLEREAPNRMYADELGSLLTSAAVTYLFGDRPPEAEVVEERELPPAPLQLERGG